MMDYTNYTREMLLTRIEELEMLNRELLLENEQETKLEFAWSGNLGHWYWNFKTNSVTFNPLKTIALGYDNSEIPENVPYQFFTDKLHPEDYQRTMDAMLDHLYGRANVYEVEYRIRAKDGKYKWFYDRGKITQFDDNGKPTFISGIVFDITEKKEMQIDLENKNKMLSEISSIDGLTGISNHRTLIDYLKSEMEQANRTNLPLTIAIFDIDHFKTINDTRGHIYGDQALVHFAKIIKQNTRGTDLAGRYGGDEFIVVFSNANTQTAANVAERIRRSVEEHTLIGGGKITISGGIKQYNGEDLKEFIHAADQKLYEAKQNGRNQIRF